MIDLSKLAHAAPDEETVYFLRPHWVTLLPVMVGFLFMLILPFGGWFALQYAHPDFFAVPGVEPIYVMIGSIFFLFCWLFLYQAYIYYFLNIWIVTTHRVIDITQSGLFGRTTSELSLEHVEDVTSEVNGFIRTMVDYGNITVQTAGAHDRFIFDNIPHPVQIAKRILELAEQRKIDVEKAGYVSPSSVAKPV